MRIVRDNESKRVPPQLSYQASATESYITQVLSFALQQNDKVAKLEQKQSKTDEKNNFIVKSDDDAKGINQSSVNTTSTKMKNSNDTSASNISDNTSNSDVAPERIENSSDNTPDSDPYQEKDSRSFTSPIPIGTLSSD
ncbi:108_t:CDS:2 [Funneliformis mosseae]|uniref:108_t:CDS:1 n=1 Tax=Funneliformis mosseae TaxID=27381 RepID=A0A9N9DQ31_FUNMO|nr:108_t:CDS:2 [Funneliformis mosseae]